MEHEDGSMFSLYGKCIYTEEALSYKVSKNAEYGDASNWLMLNPLQHDELFKKRRKGWTCNKGHKLVPGKAPSAGVYVSNWHTWCCDNCYEYFPLSESHLRCDKCCYDLCANCK